jgi:O-antigen ligase
MAVLEKSNPRAASAPRFGRIPEPMKGAFFWLSAFYFVYCARPEDWIPGLKYIPLAKISGIFALIGLFASAGKSKRSLGKLPREAFYLIGIVCLLLLGGALSPVWKGGAIMKTTDFAKVVVAWVLTYIVVSNFGRLKQIIFIQSGSVALIAIISVLKGRSHPRLDGVIGGIYSNPNDLAFAIVLSLPFCIAFLLDTKNMLKRMGWVAAMLAMCTALFLTASRGGFIELVVAGTVMLWHFGVKGKRPQLIAAAALVALAIGVTAGGRLKDRFMAISGEDLNDSVDVSAHGSYEQRAFLMRKSLDAVLHYPLGIGMGNFPNYSGTWREVHVAYLQIMAEAGIAALVLYVLFFARGFANLQEINKIGRMDEEMKLFAGALHSSLVGFLVGALFAPEAYQFFPYFAVAYTSVLLAIARERQPEPGPQEQPPGPQPQQIWRKRYSRPGELTAVR